MGLWDKIKGEFIDVIEWLDESNDTLVYRFERHNNEIKNGAKLTVRESQVAVFVNEGQIADVFTPGMYSLTTSNLPILSTLKGWKHGFESPFKAEVYFVNTKQFTGQKFGTKNPITINDDQFGLIELRAFGTYAYKVEDAGLFLKNIAGTQGDFSIDELYDHLRSMVVSRFTDAVGEANLPVHAFAGQTNEISEFLLKELNQDFSIDGLKITKFFLENISMPEEVKKEIFEYSRLYKIDLNKLAQMKAAKAMEKAADNTSGTAGAGMGMGMGMGFAMANQMGNMFTQQSQPQQQANNQSQNNGGGTPPPIPGSKTYFFAINGQQSGPFQTTEIKNMISSGQIDKNTLAWSKGMEGWEACYLVEELNQLFGSVPPPIPGV